MSRIYYPEALVVVSAVVENFSVSRKPLVFPAVPRSIQITRNSYKQPDSWSIEFDGKDFPIPPSMLRTGQVAIYLYNNKGLEGSRRVIKSTDKPAVVGLIDSVESDFSSDGRVVRFEGQDYTALFAGHVFQGKRNFTNKRLDVAIDQLRKEVDITNAMQLTVELSDDFGSTASQKRKSLPVIGASVSKTNRKGFPVKRGDTYWNVMYNLALKHGFLLFVRDLELVLTTPESVLAESTKRADRTFKLTWGKNIEQITISRSMGKERVPQVEVISYDEKTRKPLIGKYPEKKQKVTDGVGTKKNEVITTVLRGITDKKILKRLAEVQYSLIARTEQSVHFSTRELKDEADRDLLDLKAGHAFFISFDPFNSEELRKIPAGSRVQWLIQRGWTPQAANVFAEHFDRLNTFKKPFYVREATLDWSYDDGLSLSASVVNFVGKQGTPEEGEVKGVAENV